MFKYILQIIIAFSFFTGAAFAQTKNNPVAVTESGKLIKKPMITKRGKPSPYVNDYFFHTDKNNYFIKVIEGKVPADTLEKYVDKNIKLNYVLVPRGEFDSDGKEKMQSRVGPYIYILQLVKD